MASEFDGIITQSMIDKAVQKVLKKYAPQVENILKKHIESDIEGVTIPTATGGPWYRDGSPYVKRNVLAGAVTHKIEGNTLLVSSTAGSSPSVINGSVIGGWGGYLQFHETGNRGFKGQFARPAVTFAQVEANKLIPKMEEEVVKLIEASIK